VTVLHLLPIRQGFVFTAGTVESSGNMYVCRLEMHTVLRAPVLRQRIAMDAGTVSPASYSIVISMMAIDSSKEGMTTASCLTSRTILTREKCYVPVRIILPETCLGPRGKRVGAGRRYETLPVSLKRHHHSPIAITITITTQCRWSIFAKLGGYDRRRALYHHDPPVHVGVCRNIPSLLTPQRACLHRGSPFVKQSRLFRRDSRAG
jgi:hypothetical protein